MKLTESETFETDTRVVYHRVDGVMRNNNEMHFIKRCVDKDAKERKHEGICQIKTKRVITQGKTQINSILLHVSMKFWKGYNNKAGREFC